MTYDARTRDRYRHAVTATTATVAAGAIVATGWLAGGAAAEDHARVAADQQTRQDKVARARYDAWVARYGDPGQYQRSLDVLPGHPSKARVTTQYVPGATSQALVGQGGTLTAPGRPARTSGLVPPPPPPPPMPAAPSHGS